MSEKIYRFEEIMDFYPYENYQSFLKLLSWIQTEKEKIFCYVGTGLSFYFKSWGEPFKNIIEKQLVNFIDINLVNAFLNKIEEGLYLETGDDLDRLIRKQTKSEEKNGEEGGERTFNQFFLEALANRKRIENSKDIDTESIEKGNLPKETVYFLPFIGMGNCITTNCDDSIEIAFRKANKSCYSYMGKVAEGDWERNIDKVAHIFYIHGRYDNADSLIMIKSDYDEIYGTADNPVDSFNVRFLMDVASKNHLLFLGASLEGDTTYEIIHKNVRRNPANTGEHIAFLCLNPKQTKSNINIKNEREKMRIKMNNLIQHLSTRPLFMPTFSCYPVVLCEAIREAESEYWNQESCSCEQQKENLYTELHNIIQKDTVFERYDAPIPLNEKKIKRTLRYFLYDNLQRKLGWTICRVNSLDFNFPIQKPFEPQNYNAPLGNTIYIIGGKNMYHDMVENIVNSIKCWTKIHKKEFYGGIKVRVIVINSPLSEVEKRDEEINGLRDENRRLRENNLKLNLELGKIMGEDQINEALNQIKNIQEESITLQTENDNLRIRNAKLEAKIKQFDPDRINNNLDVSIRLNELTELANRLMFIFEELNDIQDTQELRKILQELKEILSELRTKIFSLGREKTLTLNLQQFESRYNDRKDGGDNEPSI